MTGSSILSARNFRFHLLLMVGLAPSKLECPLPATPGRILSESLHAGDAWTTAPWSACVLAADDYALTYSLEGRSWIEEIRWMAATSHRPLHNDWGYLLPHQIAGKLLVMWKVWWWPHWSALPFLETVPTYDQDHHLWFQLDNASECRTFLLQEICHCLMCQDPEEKAQCPRDSKCPQN